MKQNRLYFFFLLFLMSILFISCDEESDEEICDSYLNPVLEEFKEKQAEILASKISHRPPVVEGEDDLYQAKIDVWKEWSLKWIRNSQRPLEKARLHRNGMTLVPLLNENANLFVILYGFLDTTPENNQTKIIDVLNDIDNNTKKLNELFCLKQTK